MATALLASSCVFQVNIPKRTPIKLSGELSKGVIELPPQVTGVLLSTFYEMEIIQDPSPRLEYDMPVELYDNMKVEIVDSNVEVCEKVQNAINFNLRPSNNGHIKVYLPDIRKIAINGSGDIRCSALESEGLTAGVTGSGDLSISNVVCPSFTAIVTGSGDMTVSGIECDEASATVTGSGDISVRGLICNTLRGRLTGSGDIGFEGKASKAVLEVNGSGDIDAISLSCEDITRRINGSGDILVSSYR